MHDNSLVPTQPIQHTGLAAEASRAAVDTPAGLMLAMRSPRNEDMALRAILRECESRELARIATFEIDRNGTVAKGATIHLIEAIAQGWGNISWGWRELQQVPSPDGVMTSTVECWAWDLEQNVRRTVTIQVRHQRWLKPTKQLPGRLDKIEDPNMAYEHVANMAQRRVRTCIECVVPKFVIATAMAACELTRKNASMVNLEDLQKLQAAFEKLGVTVSQLENYLGAPLTAMTHSEFADFKALYRDIRDGKKDPKRVFALNTTLETDE